MAKWTEEKISAVAIKCTNRKRFNVEHGGAYRAAKRIGIFDKVTAHMNNGFMGPRKWTKGAILDVAKTVHTRTRFARDYPGAYAAAKVLGIFDEATIHMKNMCENSQLSKRTSNNKVDDKLISIGSVMKRVGDMNGVHTATEFVCNVGHVVIGYPANYMSGAGCKICKKNQPKTRKQFNEEIAHRNVRLISEYIKAHSMSTFECEYEHKWKATPTSILSGTGCPVCSVGRSDNDIVYMLKVNEINCLYKFGITSKRRGNGRVDALNSSSEMTHKIIGWVNVDSANDYECELLKLGHPAKVGKFPGCKEYRFLTPSQIDQANKIIGVA